jgi:hypothetical protein
VLAYFSLSLRGGQTARAAVVISNAAQRTQSLLVTPSLGVTAANGGTAYVVSARPCRGPACWVTGLPGTVTLGPRRHQLLHFKVTVPPGTPKGQYLAGVTARPAASPGVVPVGGQGRTRAGAIIVEEISVGVAITVGRLASLRTRFRVPGVTGEDLGTTARLDIRLANTGQTFAHAAGTASCISHGQPFSYPVSSAVILPRQAATVAVNAPGLAEGARLACTVLLQYAGHQAAGWSGDVAIPAMTRQLVHTGPNVYSAVPPATRAAWLPWLIAALAVAGAVAVAVASLRYRRRHVW